jgi:hypothetical protein
MSSKFRLFTELEVKCQVQSQVESCCYLRGGRCSYAAWTLLAVHFSTSRQQGRRLELNLVRPSARGTLSAYAALQHSALVVQPRYP